MFRFQFAPLFKEAKLSGGHGFDLKNNNQPINLKRSDTIGLSLPNLISKLLSLKFCK